LVKKSQIQSIPREKKRNVFDFSNIEIDLKKELKINTYVKQYPECSYMANKDPTMAKTISNSTAVSTTVKNTPYGKIISTKKSSGVMYIDEAATPPVDS
jgi:hypothetical protein